MPTWIIGVLKWVLPEATAKTVIICLVFAAVGLPYYFVTIDAMNAKAEEILLVSSKGDAYQEQRWIKSEKRATETELYNLEVQVEKSEKAPTARTKRRLRTLEQALKQLNAEDRAIQKKLEGKK